METMNRNIDKVQEDDPDNFTSDPEGDYDGAGDNVQSAPVGIVRCRGCGMMAGTGTRCERCNTPVKGY